MVDASVDDALGEGQNVQDIREGARDLIEVLAKFSFLLAKIN